MRTPESVKALETLGRARLSPSFFMREFLYSEVANFHGVPNIPVNPDLAIANGKRLCTELLEPMNATFGRVSIRSAYRSPTVNDLCNKTGSSCASNESNYAGHIWDMPDAHGQGAMACIVLPWFAERYEKGADWRGLAYWIHNHLPYSELQFFPELCAFNIGWHEQPVRKIRSFIKPPGVFVRGEPPNPAYAEFYAGFPPLRQR
jgi:hypothetical protein